MMIKKEVARKGNEVAERRARGLDVESEEWLEARACVDIGPSMEAVERWPMAEGVVSVPVAVRRPAIKKMSNVRARHPDAYTVILSVWCR